MRKLFSVLLEENKIGRYLSSHIEANTAMEGQWPGKRVYYMADLDRGSVVKKLIKVAMDKGNGSKNGPTDRPTNEPTLSGMMLRGT